MTEAKPITHLKGGDKPTTVTVSDCAFFKYSIEHKSELEKVLLLLNISVKNRIQVYINKKPYPS